MRSSATDLDEPTVAHERLDAIGLRSERAGWVPEAPPLEASEVQLDAPPGGDRASRVPLERLIRGWLQDRLPPWTHGLVDRARLGTVAGGAVGVVVLVIAAVVLLHHPSSGSSGVPTSSYDASADAAPVSTDPIPSVSAFPAAAAAPSIVVDVGGRVHKPGLVTLPAGARVADALAAAGGPLHHKEIATLDLAARVSDGQLLLIGTPAAPSGAAGSATSADGSDPSGVAPVPISLSTATLEDLETLPGVGPVTAQKIIDWRTANNGFTSVEQLQQVSGIGPAHYAAISPLVTP